MNEFYKIREDLHKIPEIALEEFKTSAYIRNYLDNLGIEYKTIGTSTLAFIPGKIDKWVAFRADIDALPMQEENDAPYKSVHEGCMHACGHDGHTTNLLIFAKWLKEKVEKEGPLNNSVMLIFQAAEEGNGGAKYIADDPAFCEKDIKGVFALHVSPDIPEGVISSKSGPITFQNINMDITVTGKGCHGAQAYQGIDSILVAAKLIEAYQSIISRNVRAIDPALLTIGSIHAGTVRNIIPEKVEMLGTVRLLSKDLVPLIVNRLNDINAGFEKSYGVKINMEATPFYPPVVNSPELFELLKKSCAGKLIEGEPLSGSEDFSFFIEKGFPGLMFLLGTRNEEKNFIYPLHNSKFDFDPKALALGFETFKNILMNMENM